MFQPNQSDVRRFFCAAYAGQRAGAPLDPMSSIAARWIAEHPESHAALADETAALQAEDPGGGGRGPPLLHRAMHPPLAEQDVHKQPPTHPPRQAARAERRPMCRSSTAFQTATASFSM